MMLWLKFFWTWWPLYRWPRSTRSLTKSWRDGWRSILTLQGLVFGLICLGVAVSHFFWGWETLGLWIMSLCLAAWVVEITAWLFLSKPQAQVFVEHVGDLRQGIPSEWAFSVYFAQSYARIRLGFWTPNEGLGHRPGLLLRARAEGRYAMSIDLRPRWIGRYCIGEWNLSSLGPLGLLQKTLSIPVVYWVQVLPVPQETLVGIVPSVAHRSKDLDQFAGLREMQMGDSLHQLDMRAFARLGRPMTRVWEAEVQRQPVAWIAWKPLFIWQKAYQLELVNQAAQLQNMGYLLRDGETGEIVQLVDLPLGFADWRRGAKNLKPNSQKEDICLGYTGQNWLGPAQTILSLAKDKS